MVHAMRIVSLLIVAVSGDLKTRSSIAGTVKVTNGRQPNGHFLTKSELEPINAIACLKAKQMNPAVICENSTISAPDGAYIGLAKNINAGNYPNYQDTVCNSYGEYFCDPQSTLTPQEGQNLAAQLKKLREANVVTCGGLLNDKNDPLHYQPFYLGVVIAKGWPVAQSDPESLQQFGQIVASQWHMDNLYVGSSVPYARCPNTAVLIILPDTRQAYLSSASCEFVCASRGGPEVVTASLAALDSGNPASRASRAALAGIETVYKAVANIPGRSSVPVVSVRADSEANLERKAERALPVYNFVMRVAFGIALVMLLISIAIGILVIFISPGVMAKSRKK